MTKAVDWDVKHRLKQTNKQTKVHCDLYSLYKILLHMIIVVPDIEIK